MKLETIKILFKKIKYRIIKRKILLILLLVILGGFLLSLPLGLGKLGDVEYRAGLLRDHPAITKILPVYWKIRKISDIVYLPYYFRKSKVPTYELYIDSKARQKLNDSLPKGFMGVVYSDKVWVNAKFKFAGKEYDVKVRYRGDNAVHWNAPKKSYLVKFDKDNPFNGVERLSFIIVDDRLFNFEQFNNYRAEKLGLIYPESSFGNLKINGKNNGLYFMIESWSEAMLAGWEVPDASNFYSNLGEEDQESVSGVAYNFTIWDNLNLWDKLVDDERFNYQHYSEIYQLLKLLDESSDKEFFNSIFSLVDKDNFYAWQIQQELVHSNHQTDDLRLYFNNSNGKFYFIPWDLGNTSPDEEINLYSALAKRIFTNPIFSQEKDRKLYDYVADEKNLEDDLAFYDQTYKDIKVALYKDRMKIYTNHWANQLVAGKRKEVIEAIDKIKNRFDNNLVFVDVGVMDNNSQKFQGNNILAFFDFHLQSYAGLNLTNFNIESNDDILATDYKFYYDSNTNDSLDSSDQLLGNYSDVLFYSNRTFDSIAEGGKLQLTKHRFYLVSDKITSTEFSDNFEDIKFNLKNAITEEDLKEENVRVKIINNNVFSHFDQINDINRFERENPIFQVNRDKKEIILPSGTYDINKTIIIPKGFTVKILSSTILRMAPGVSIVSYSNVIAQGSIARPVNIFGQDRDKPWGVFAVLNSDQKSSFSYCQFSGGKDDYINGAYLSGMLSVYFSDVIIEHSEFYNAKADDSLNVKKAKAEIINSKFLNNSADAIDFDFIKEGKISNNEFYNNGNDGIDLSGSSILIAENYIENSGDKCISVGEEALNTIIYNNVLNGCNIGIEIKDLSDVPIINNVIINSKSVGVNAYQKKPIFGGGRASVYNSIIWGNKVSVQTDQASKISVYNSDLEGSSGENSNFSLEPVFNNQKAKDFTVSPGSDRILFINGGSTQILFDLLGVELEEAPVGLNW